MKVQEEFKGQLMVVRVGTLKVPLYNSESQNKGSGIVGFIVNKV